MGNAINMHVTHPDTTPKFHVTPSFDPMLGFPNGRKPRVMHATQAELESAKIPIQNRDYCSHSLLNYQSCRADVWPLVYKCSHEKHEYLNCEYEDYIMRMKEYERERRLLERQKRKELAAA